METSNLWTAIIAGGQGTRLFPISHPSCPKQFCELDERNTFIQAVIENFTFLGVKPTHIVVVVTSENQMELAKKQCLPRGVLSQNIIEVSPKLGYAGSMIKATEYIYELDPNAVVINTPADQYVVPDFEFRATIESAVNEANQASNIKSFLTELVQYVPYSLPLYKPKKRYLNPADGTNIVLPFEPVKRIPYVVSIVVYT